MGNDTDSVDGDAEESFERRVKEFGNGAHVTLPKQLVGEDVVVTIDREVSSDSPLQPPIQRSDLNKLFLNMNRDDFTFEDDGRGPMGGKFVFEDDMRLKINVELAYETDPVFNFERGRVIHWIGEPTASELREHTDWFPESGTEDDVSVKTIHALEPEASVVLDSPMCGYADVYRCTVTWNGTELFSCMFQNRSAKQGLIYYPAFEDFRSLADYQDSLEYALAVGLSKTPREDYDEYLDILGADGGLWGANSGSHSTDKTRKQILSECDIYNPITGEGPAEA